MIELLQSGKATPEQQIEIAKHLKELGQEILLLRGVIRKG